MNSEVVVFPLSEPLAIATSAWLSHKGITNYRLVLAKSVKFSAEVSSFLESLGAIIEYGDADSISLDGVKEVYLHTFGAPFEKLAALIEKCHQRSIDLVCYADGLKGEYSIDFLKRSGARRMFFLGWVFDKGGLDNMSIEVLPLDVLISTCKKFRSKTAEPQRQFPSSLVVLMRYWGHGDYQIKNGVSLAEAMFRSIPFSADAPVDKIFIKSDPRVAPEARSTFLKYCAEKVTADVFDFTELVGAPASADRLPVEMLWFEKTGASCYSYDSTVSIYLTALGEEKILFPNFAVLPEIFERSHTTNLVISYCNIIRRVCDAIKREGIQTPLIVNVDANIPPRLVKS